MTEYYRASEAAEFLRVTPQTVRKYRRAGKLNGYKTPGGQHIYKKDELENLLLDKGMDVPSEQKTIAFYIRSSDGDKVKMDEQLRLLTEKYGQPDFVYKDKASGLNEKRKGLQRLLRDASQHAFNELHFTQKDRLTRFGYDYLELFLSDKGVSVSPAFDKPDKSLQEELMQDFMSLIASFSGKFYRLRGYEQKKQLLADAGKCLDDTRAGK